MVEENRDSVREFANEHVMIEGLADEVLASIRVGDWAQCNEVWVRFSEAVHNHLDTEEIEIFPDFHDDSIVRRLVAEHEQIRRRLDQLVVAIQGRLAEPDALVELIGTIRAHGSYEDEVLYPRLRRELP